MLWVYFAYYVLLLFDFNSLDWHIPYTEPRLLLCGASWLKTAHLWKLTCVFTPRVFSRRVAEPQRRLVLHSWGERRQCEPKDHTHRHRHRPVHLMTWRPPEPAALCEMSVTVTASGQNIDVVFIKPRIWRSWLTFDLLQDCPSCAYFFFFFFLSADCQTHALWSRNEFFLNWGRL